MIDETHVDEVFLQVVDLPLEARARALGELCTNDEVRRRVEALLGWDARVPDGFLAGEDRAEVAAESGARIGPYRIIERLGEGGMGTVYAVRQSFPLRDVALKVLRAGRISEDAVRRFRHEIDVLGRLQHNGIARIYDAGVTEAPDAYGAPHEVPFFTMELVRGTPLVTYAREKNLPNESRIELLARVCDAVHYAHQRGVIHRDLKPDNVLVSEEDSAFLKESGTHESVIGQPKVLDFGIARVIDPELPGSSHRTEAGALLGTLACMSPEQVSGDTQLIDVRTDVYALGVMLYELLCGRPPLLLNGLTVPQAAQHILSEIPISPGEIDPELRGDLSTIALKAVEKDPERRYQTAFELAGDLRAFLRGEPIEARSDSRMYLLRRSLRRHRMALGVSMAFAILLGVFAIVSVKQALASEVLAASESRARKMADEDFDRAIEAIDVLTTLGTESLRDIPQAEETRSELLEAALKFQRGLLEAHPDEPGLRNRQATARLHVAQLERLLGKRDRALSEIRLAVQEYEALGFTDKLEDRTLRLQYIDSLLVLGNLLYRSAQLDEAAECLSRAVALSEREMSLQASVLGPVLQRFGAAHRHQSICSRLRGIGEDSIEPLENAMERFEQVMSEESRLSVREEYLALLQELTILKYEQGLLEGLEEDYLRAIALAEELRESQPRSPRAVHDLGGLRCNYAVLLADQGRETEAEAQLGLAIESGEQLVKEHPALERPKEILFNLYHNRVKHRLITDLVGAEADAERVEELLTALLASQPTTDRLAQFANLDHVRATIQIQCERFAEAIESLESTIRYANQALQLTPARADMNVLLRYASINLALSLAQTREHERAVDVLRQVVYVADGHVRSAEVAAALRVWQTTVRAVEQDEELSAPEQEVLVEEYLALATNYFESAVELGFDDAAALPTLGSWERLVLHPPFARVLGGQ